ncbi:MAG: flagellar hook-length control protein FliK, partial [Lachnospiraceae bacterium]|nr:flagellar hook-length control protein FliK [Lachnospiraceae bacterium]
MANTSVKGVGNVMNALNVANQSAVSHVGEPQGAGFQSVWNEQTGKEAPAEEPKVAENKSTSHKEEALKAKGAVRKEVKEAPQDEQAEAVTDTDKLEKASQVLGTAAAELMEQVADTFGITVEELSQIMADMNMSTLDMLNPEKLSALLLSLGGETDTLSLLTNEALYSDFKQLMSEQGQLLSKISDRLQVPKEQIPNMLEQVQVAEETLSQEPMIEISVETDDKAGGRIIPQKADVLTGEQSEQVVHSTNAQEQSPKESKQENADTQNPFGDVLMQNLKTQSTQAESVQTTQSTLVWDADTQNIMRQIMDYMKMQIKPEVSDLEMQLHPASLGRLQIHVSSKGGVLTANFVTQNEAVKAALESQMVQLKENFAEQGVKVEAIEVTVQTHEFERNLEQGRGRNQGEPEKKSRPRRINLNASSDTGELSDLSKEDALAAEMMTANGNTVDYTA